MIISPGAMSTANMGEVVGFEEASDVQDDGACYWDWSDVSSQSELVQEAVGKAFDMVAAERADCEPDVGKFAFAPEDFFKGGGSKHRVHAHVKSASDCKSK